MRKSNLRCLMMKKGQPVQVGLRIPGAEPSQTTHPPQTLTPPSLLQQESCSHLHPYYSHLCSCSHPNSCSLLCSHSHPILSLTPTLSPSHIFGDCNLFHLLKLNLHTEYSFFPWHCSFHIKLKILSTIPSS